jgi:hypothetical protein
MSLKGMEGLEGCSQWNSMRDQTRSDGGRAEPPGGGEAVWRSPEHDQEDASVVGSARLPAARHGHPHRTSIDDPTSSPAISRYILPIGPFMISLAVFFCSSLRTE